MYDTLPHQGGALVSISNRGEFNFVTKQIEKVIKVGGYDMDLELWWTGGKKAGSEWVWDEGEFGKGVLFTK